MDLTELGEMALGIAARAAASGGFRALLAQEPDVVEQAIAETCSDFEAVEGADPALTRWVSSAAFESIYKRLIEGDRNFGTEIIESFTSVGDFYVPETDESEDTAGQIVSTFLDALLGGLLRSSDGIPTLSNRQERLHSETREHVDAGFAQIRRDLRSLLAPAVTETTGQGTPENVQHAKAEAQIDSARDLIKEGKVIAAASILELAGSQTDSLSPELEFRRLTNLGACALAKDDLEQACAYLRQAHNLQPDNPKAVANGALAARLDGDLKLAVELAHRALELKPRDPSAAAVLLEALHDSGKVSQLDEFVASEDWLLAERQPALTLAQVRVDQGRFDEALDLSRHLATEGENDYETHLVLASCLLAASRTGHGGDVVGWRGEAEEHATRALKLLKDTDLLARRVQALSIRAEAHLTLGRLAEAMIDIEGALHIAPNDSSVLYNRAALLLETGRFTEARAAFERIEDPEIGEKALLPLAVACHGAGDAQAATALLQGAFSLEHPTWDDIRKAELLCEAERSLGTEDTVGAMLEVALRGQPDSPRVLVLAAKHGEVWDKPVDAATLLLEALGSVSDDDRFEVVGRLANLYARQERFSDAADWYLELVGDDPSHPSIAALLGSLGNSGRLREALAWARLVRERHPYPPRVSVEVEAQILARVGNVTGAVECWEELCSRDDGTPLDQARLAHALFRCGDRDGARETVRPIDPSELVTEPRELIRLAQLKQVLGEPEYLRDAFLARRYGMDDPSVHLGYFSLFVSREKEMPAPEAVGPGCAVLLQQGSDEQWWGILEPGEESRGPNELSPGTSLAQALLDRQRGDTVTLQEGIGELSYTIGDIQSKYVRAFQETASGFPTRFPGNTDLSSVPVTEDDITKFLGVIDERDRFVRGLQELYQDGPVPFAFLCARLGRPAPELWRAFTAGDDLRIRFSAGSESEMKRSEELLPHASSIVLDMLALLTVHKLGLADQLQRRFDRINVPQSVLDELRNLVIETTAGAKPNGHVGRNIDGTYALVEMSEEGWSQHQEFARSVLSLAEAFEPIASYPELDVASDDIEEFSGWVTEAGIGAMFAGGEEGEARPLLVSDDLGLANLARALGVEAVNTQAVLRELRRTGELADEEYSSFIAKIAVLNYRFLQVETADILRLLEANPVETDEGTRALLSTLRGPECAPESAVAVVTDLVATLARKGLPEQRETLLISVLLGTLRHGRETTNVLEECLRKV